MKQRKFDSKTNETIEYKFKESEDSNNEWQQRLYN
jgi:hypothetical protein